MQEPVENREFLQAYNDLADPIFRHCYFRVFDREKAKDIMQDVFLKTWKYIADGNNIENIKAFIYKIANNLIIDNSRKKNTESLDDLKEKGFDVGENKKQILENKIDASHIIIVANQLSQDYKEVIIMRYLEGLGPKEISEILGLTETNVSVCINRGIKELKKLLVNK